MKVNTKDTVLADSSVLPTLDAVPGYSGGTVVAFTVSQENVSKKIAGSSVFRLYSGPFSGNMNKEHLNTSTPQHLNTSTPQHLNTSTPQHLPRLTSRAYELKQADYVSARIHFKIVNIVCVQTIAPIVVVRLVPVTSIFFSVTSIVFQKDFDKKYATSCVFTLHHPLISGIIVDKLRNYATTQQRNNATTQQRNNATTQQPRLFSNGPWLQVAESFTVSFYYRTVHIVRIQTIAPNVAVRLIPVSGNSFSVVFTFFQKDFGVNIAGSSVFLLVNQQLFGNVEDDPSIHPLVGSKLYTVSSWLDKAVYVEVPVLDKTVSALVTQTSALTVVPIWMISASRNSPKIIVRLRTIINHKNHILGLGLAAKHAVRGLESSAGRSCRVAFLVPNFILIVKFFSGFATVILIKFSVFTYVSIQDFSCSFTPSSMFSLSHWWGCFRFPFSKERLFLAGINNRKDNNGKNKYGNTSY